MARKKLFKFGMVLVLVATMVFLGACFPVDTGTEAEDGGFATSIWPMIIFIVVLFALMYFVMIRPQRRRQKEHQDLIEELHRGDKVVTTGGIYGDIESVSDDSVLLKMESGATIRVAKSSVVTKQYKPEARIG